VTLPNWPGVWFDRHPSASEFVGLSREDAERAAATAGITSVRVIDPEQDERRYKETGERVAYTANLRPTRLNLAIEKGRVARAAFF